MFIPKFDDIIVFDTETTINAEKPHFGATPHHPDNEVVAFGWMHLRKGFPKPEVTLRLGSSMNSMFVYPHEAGDELVLVGHNIAFDLAYLRRDLGSIVPKNLVIWDTMKFEYMDCGRAIPNPSLEKTAQIHGISFEKDTEVSERFKMGIGADKIDRDLLLKYLTQDVKVTYDIFNKQLKKCIDKGAAYTNYMLEMMQGIEATTSMGLDGINFNVPNAKIEVGTLEDTIEILLEELNSEWGDFNFNSPAQIKLLLWGGEKKEEYLEDKLDEDGKPVRYKSGKRKGEIVKRRATKMIPIEGLVNDAVRARVPAEDAAAPTLERIKKFTDGLTSANRFCTKLLEIRKATKAANTYYKPYIEYSIRGTIHPNFNHCVTQTGRLSSSRPNMQNISNKGE